MPQELSVEQCHDALHRIAHESILDLEADYPETRRSLVLEFDDLRDDAPGLVDDVLAAPVEAREAFEQALAEYEHGEREIGMGMANVRIRGLPDRRTFDVGLSNPSRYINSLIELEGQITKRTEVTPKVEVAAFRCWRCGSITRVRQPNFGKIREPHECQDCEMQGPFLMDESRSEWIDHQIVRLNEPPEAAVDGATSSIDVHLLDDLAGAEGVKGGARGAFVGRYKPVRDGGNVRHKRILVAQAWDPEDSAVDDDAIREHREAIERIAESPDPLACLVGSFAPSHEGDEHLKLAVVLQLLSDFSTTGTDGKYHRGNSHIAFVGDPGTGKSDLLDAANAVAPRAAKTSGESASGAGLTAALEKDEFGDGAWSITAGTLPKADGGIAVIDEFDKADDSDIKQLHTALESQVVPVSKAGRQAILPAETAVLAAMNPTGGHYAPSKKFVDQVGLQSPMLSRFDLIFVVRAKEDRELVEEISETMARARNVARRIERGDDVDDDRKEDVAPEVPPDVFSAYLQAAHRVQPVVEDDDVLAHLEQWFVETQMSLPDRYDTDDPDEGPPLPITARKQDALHRLAAASARARLSQTITRADIDRVKRLLERSLADVGIEPASSAALGDASGVDATEVGLGP